MGKSKGKPDSIHYEATSNCRNSLDLLPRVQSQIQFQESSWACSSANYKGKKLIHYIAFIMLTQ